MGGEVGMLGKVWEKMRRDVERRGFGVAYGYKYVGGGDG